MATERKPDMWDDCHRLLDMRADRAAMVAELNALPARIREQERRIEEVATRIEARVEAKDSGMAVAIRHAGRDYSLCLGTRGELQVRESLSPFAFRDDEAEAIPAPVIAADAATDAPSADDDMREAVSAFDLDDDISEAAFRAALEDELGPGGADATWAITGKPATDDEYRDAMAAGLIPRSAVG